MFACARGGGGSGEGVGVVSSAQRQPTSTLRPAVQPSSTPSATVPGMAPGPRPASPRPSPQAPPPPKGPATAAAPVYPGGTRLSERRRRLRRWFRIAAHHIRVACSLIQAFLFLWSASSKERQRITPAKIRYLLAPSYFAQIAHIMISREFHTPRFDLRFCLFDFRRDIHSTDLN